MTATRIPFGEFVVVQPSVPLERGAEYPFVAMEDVEPRRRMVVPGSERVWDGGGGARFENGDVLFARITPCLEHGKTSQVQELQSGAGFGSTEFFVFRGRDNISDSRYIYYLACSDAIRLPAIKSMVGASGRQRAQRTVIEETVVTAPPLPMQRRIADILSAYDDLIENNRRRMALLEEAARQLYREWFVRLRFPGHEHTHITNGVPEGWEKRSFGDALAYEIGGGWGQDEPTGGETEEGYVIRGTDIPEVEGGNFGAVGLRYHDPRRLPQRALQAGDIVFEVSGGSATQAIGRTLLVTEETLRVLAPRAICASFCKLLRVSDSRLPYFLLRFLRHIRESGELAVYQKQSASALQNFQYKSFLAEQQVLLPTAPLLKEFCSVQADLVRQQQILGVQNHKLRAARDLLLPRLMNGEITV